MSLESVIMDLLKISGSTVWFCQITSFILLKRGLFRFDTTSYLPHLSHGY